MVEMTVATFAGDITRTMTLADAATFAEVCADNGVPFLIASVP